ncbi:Integrin beta-like protein 1 [Sparganum proliferum]
MQEFGCPERFTPMADENIYNQRPRIRGTYRTHGHLLNSRRMQTPTRLSGTTVYDLLFVGDCVFNTVSEVDKQRSMDLRASGCANFGLTTNMDKTVVMHQPPPNAAYSVRHIHVNGAELETVSNFAYLGSTLSGCIKIDDKVAGGSSKAAKPSATAGSWHAGATATAMERPPSEEG